MKKIVKKISVLFFMCLLFATVLPCMTKQTEAAERRQVMTISVTDKYKTTSRPVYAVQGMYGCYFEMDQSTFSIFKDKDTDKVKVSVTVNDPNFIVAESLEYNKEIDLSGTNSYQYVSFDYSGGSSYFYYYISPFEVNLKIDSLIVASSSKGFYPSSGNYLPIYSTVLVDSNYYGASGDVKLRLRVNDSKGRYVYQKTFAVNGNGYGSLNYRWNGKASKNNAARARAGAYVKSGTYKVEIYLYYNGGGYKKAVTTTRKLVVSKKAPKGIKGLAKAKQVPMLTGDVYIDYMAEKMVKEAGVKSSMSQDQKVKKIYHYMTKKFKHVHYGEKAPKPHFNLSKLERQVTSYRRVTDSNLRKGKLIYNYYRGAGQWNMSRRCGTCGDHAAIFKVLCNHVGIDAGICSGYYKNRNGSLAPHSWNYAVVDGKTYYYDVDVEIQNYRGGQGDYYWYKKTKSQAKKNHKFY